jgi:hypothetical protein
LSEKYLRKLIGKAEIEDALKRLDKLTNEEARMVTAEVLDATHIVNDRVVRMDDRVTRVDEGVARVDEGVTRVDDRVARVDEGVTRIDDRVAAGIHGAQRLSSVTKGLCLTLMCLEIQQVADNMDQVRSSSFSFSLDIGVQTQPSSQGTNYARNFARGSLRRIRLLTTILPVGPITRKHLSGFSVGVSLPNGSLMPHFYGSTENVRSPNLSSATDADAHLLKRALGRAYSGLSLSNTVKLCYSPMG